MTNELKQLLETNAKLIAINQQLREQIEQLNAINQALLKSNEALTKSKEFVQSVPVQSVSKLDDLTQERKNFLQYLVSKCVYCHREQKVTIDGNKVAISCVCGCRYRDVLYSDADIIYIKKLLNE